MRLETVPLVLGVLVAVVGLALLVDASTPDDLTFTRERRRRPRAERDRLGEALVGLGVIAMAIALLARDTWRYRILTVVVGAALLVWGAKRSANYLRGVLARATGTPPPFKHVISDHPRDHHPRAAP